MKQNVEKVIHNNALLAIIVRSTYYKSGIEFFTPSDFSQQLAYMNRPAGYIITPHVHNMVQRKVDYTQEVLFIKKGKVKIDFYDDDKNYFVSHILGAGDVILLAHGGHGIEMLENSEIIEVKQGPYAGEMDKVRFEPVGKSFLGIEDGQ